MQGLAVAILSGRLLRYLAGVGSGGVDQTSMRCRLAKGGASSF